MSKKDFIALADALKSVRPLPATSGQPHDQFVTRLAALEQWQACKDAIADVCAIANPKFDRHRWLGYILGELGPNGGRK